MSSRQLCSKGASDGQSLPDLGQLSNQQENQPHMHLKRLEPEIAEAMDIYKALGNDTYYGLEEQSADPPQQEDQ